MKKKSHQDKKNRAKIKSRNTEQLSLKKVANGVVMTIVVDKTLWLTSSDGMN